MKSQNKLLYLGATYLLPVPQLILKPRNEMYVYQFRRALCV